MASEAELIDLLHAGHWFLKHRSNGDVPHRRFVFVENSTIFWATRQDRTGKLGSMPVDMTMLVVPGSATPVTSGKKKLQERRNRLFSIVGSARSLDLEAGTEAERHLWVRTFSSFIKMQKAMLEAHATNGMPRDHSSVSPYLDRPASLSASRVNYLQPEAHGPGSSQPLLVRNNTEELMAGVRFPRMRGSFHVLLGDIARSWQVSHIHNTLVTGHFCAAFVN